MEALPDGFLSEVTKLLDSLDARPRRERSPRGLTHRGELGDFISISWLQAAVRGLEDVLGLTGTAVVLIRAGRQRGQALVEDWGVGHPAVTTQKLGLLLDAALGRGGIRLCRVSAISDDGQDIRVEVAETVSAARQDAGEVPPSQLPGSTYTLGAVWGVLEALTGERYECTQMQRGAGTNAGEQFVFRRRP